MEGFRVRVMGLGMVGNGDDVVRIDGVVGHRVASVTVGSEVGGRCEKQRVDDRVALKV